MSNTVDSSDLTTPAVVTCDGCGATFDVEADGIDFGHPSRRQTHVTWGCPDCYTANDVDLEV